MKEASLFMILFGILLVAAGVALCCKKDPRTSLLLGRVHGLEKMTKKKAKNIAVTVGSTVTGVGLAIMVYFIVRLVK